ncbi:MAG: hypothetical protein HY670_04885 [Chloroflexi bacterium]|nr:hypothetical protein [Chloroflexota bacterium]
MFTEEIVKFAEAITYEHLPGAARYAHPPEMGAGLTNMGGEIVIKLRDGTSYSCKVQNSKGSPQDPLSGEEMDNKFRDCAGLFLPASDTDRVLHFISHFETLADVAELMDILTFGAVCHSS